MSLTLWGPLKCLYRDGLHCRISYTYVLLLRRVVQTGVVAVYNRGACELHDALVACDAVRKFSTMEYPRDGV